MGVLVAISIPIFTSQLNKAKYSTDLANARAIYAELQADYLANGEVQKASVDKKSVTAGTETIITITEPDNTTVNTYKFSGIVGVTITTGNTDNTTTVQPKVEVAACTKADADAVNFPAN